MRKKDILQKIAIEFAKGIPQRVYSEIPNIKDQKALFVIQKHDADRSGRHYDVRLQNPGTQTGFSWVIKNHPPKAGERVLARRTFDHDVSYFPFEGKIYKGYGKGKVKRHMMGDATIVKGDENKITYMIHDQRVPIRNTLLKLKDKDWLLINHTPTEKIRSEIPREKVKFKIEKSPEKFIENNNVLFSPKIDGAESVVVLKNHKMPEVFSYRRAKNKSGLIDHTLRLGMHREISNVKGSKPTVLWGETYATDQSGNPIHISRLSGLLNSNLNNFQENTKGLKFRTMVHDINTYRGKSVQDLPYAEKLKLIDDVVKDNKFLDPPIVAGEPKEKRNLYDRIKNDKYQLTREGLVLYDKNKSIPSKSKFDIEKKVYIRSIQPGQGKYQNAAGGYEYSYAPSGSIVGVVGGGFSDEMRRDMYKHPEKYIGKQAEVKAQEQLKSQALRMPIHIRLTEEKWPSKK